jgi:O-antigen/teichoic acid export membrane protein
VTLAAPRPDSSALRDTAILLSTTVLGLAASIGTQSCLAWFLAPAGRGAFAVCVTFASVVAVVFGLATDRAVQYHLIAREFTVGRSLAIGAATALAASTVAVAIGWALIDTPHPFFGKAEPGSFRLALLLIPLMSLFTLLGLLLAGVGRFLAMGLLGLVVTGASLVLTLVLVGLLGLGVQGALWAFILANGVGVGLRARAVWRSGAGIERPRAGDFGRVLAYGVRFYVARLGNVVNVQVGTIVMAWVGNPVEVGLFAAAWALIGRVMVVPDSVSTVLQPRVGPDVAGRPALVAAASRVTLAVVGCGLALLLATSGIVVPILLSEAFAGAVPLLWLLAPGIWLKSASRPMTAYFIGVNRPGVASLSTAVELATNVVGMPLLYQSAGLLGAAGATAGAQVLGALVLVVAFRAGSGLKLGETWRPRGSDFVPFASHARQLWSRTRSARAGDVDTARRFHRSELLADRVVKHRPPELIRVEAEKTARAAAIGAATGLFRVPSVLAADASGGTLVTERVAGIRPLHGLLRRGIDADRLVVDAARALAAIHARLALPDPMRHRLREEWSTPESAEVVLHGDYNTFNLFVGASGELVVTDWEMSFLAHSVHDNAPSEIPTTGPRWFDLAWFVTSLFRRTWLGIGRIRAAPARADAFLSGYFEAAGPEARGEGFSRYFARVVDLLEAAEAARGASGLEWIRRPRRELVCYRALRSYAASLESRPASSGATSGAGEDSPSGSSGCATRGASSDPAFGGRVKRPN